MKLSELLEQIDNGELKLPSFQRSYRWKPSKVKKLLDSLQKNHPAGSLLLLQVDSRKCVVEQDNFKFADGAEQEAEYLVLDGQQRLTSCYCAFYNKGNRSYYLDLRRLHNEVSNLDEDI